MLAALALLPLLLGSPVPGAQAPSTLGEAEGFESLSRQAAAAREADRLDEAVDRYRQAVELRPEWDEGWWYLGSLHYQANRYADAVDALARFLELKPRTPAGWALRGLCEFEEGELEPAIEHLSKALDLDIAFNEELKRVTRLQLGRAMIKTGQFEQAVAPLSLVAQTTPEGPLLLETFGLLLLRMPLLASEIPEERRELVRQAGRAAYLHMALRYEEAGRAFAELVARYPDETWVHYAHGVFLLRDDAPRAILSFRRAVEVDRGNVMALLELAFALLTQNRPAEAREAAERAVAFAPRLFAGHNALGRALLELGETERAVAELEEAVQLAPELPEGYFALARAYDRAGRTDEAARTRETFREIERRRREGEEN